MNTVIAFVLGIMFGGTVGFLISAVLSVSGDEDRTVYIPRGINPDALIAWIENHRDNYEYTAPPTTGEIIRKIEEMSYDAE